MGVTGALKGGQKTGSNAPPPPPPPGKANIRPADNRRRSPLDNPPPPPPADQSDHRGGKRNSPLGKSNRAVLDPRIFGSLIHLPLISSHVSLPPLSPPPHTNHPNVTLLLEPQRVKGGHVAQVVPSKVTLGGKMYNIQESATSASSRSSASNSSTSTSVGGGWGLVSAGASTDSGSTNSAAAADSDASSKASWNTIGGNSLLSGNVATWTPTVAYPENWGIITFDEMIDLTSSPLFPESARKKLNELMTTPEYAVVFGTGSSAGSMASSSAGDALLGVVQIPDQSGRYYLSIPHSSEPGAVAFFREGCFTSNMAEGQVCAPIPRDV